MSDSPGSPNQALSTQDADGQPHHRTGRPQASYTEEQRQLALAAYAETGSLQTASEQANIPRNTLRYWVENDPDIDAKLDAIRRAIRERAAYTMAELVICGARELLDRVQNGDYHVDKEGNITRRPMPGRELAFVVATMTDKHALVTGTMTRVNAEDQALTTLADKLVKAIEARRKPATITYPQAEDGQNA